jgi:hypothetical protein
MGCALREAESSFFPSSDPSKGANFATGLEGAKEAIVCRSLDRFLSFVRLAGPLGVAEPSLYVLID